MELIIKQAQKILNEFSNILSPPIKYPKNKVNNKISNKSIKDMFNFMFKSSNNRIRNIGIKKRYYIYQRDNYTCKLCSAKGQRIGGSAALCIDHIIPIKLGGSNDNKNLRTLCYYCNSKKSDKYIYK